MPGPVTGPHPASDLEPESESEAIIEWSLSTVRAESAFKRPSPMTRRLAKIMIGVSLAMIIIRVPSPGIALAP